MMIEPAKKKATWKRILVGCGLVVALVLATIVGLGYWLLSEQEGSERTTYHPFRSAEAKERFLKAYDLRASKWPIVSEVKTVETSYGQTFVRISGSVEAPPLVLLHGMGGNSLQWEPNIKALSEFFRTYAVDNIYDYGRSVYTRPIKTSNDFMNWLDELFNVLGVKDRINLMGLSYGGWLTSQYALHSPARLDRIVLLAPAATILPLQPEWMVRAVLCAVPFRPFTRSFMYWLMEDFSHKDDASRMELEGWVDDSFLAIRCFKPKPLVNPTVLEDQELQSIRTPALYLVGENEKIYSSRQALNRLQRVAPQIKAELIPRSGHDLSIVQAETVNRKVLDFLKQP